MAMFLAGCGTAMNFWLTPREGGCRPYGGVRVDAEVARDCAADAAKAETTGERIIWYSKAAYLVADLPVSLVGDTLTLPFTLPCYRSFVVVGPYALDAPPQLSHDESLEP
jgi:uncharacterized protein YceK